MTALRSIQRRVAVAYVGTVLAAMAGAAIFLVLELQGRGDVDETGSSFVGTVVLTLAVTGGIVVAFSLLLAGLVVRSIKRSLGRLSAAVQRLAEGDLDHRVPSGLVPEVRELAEALNVMAYSLKGKLAGFSGDRDKLSTILATMTDGVALLDHEGRTTLVNPAARDFLALPADVEDGQRFIEMVRDHELSALVSRCRETKTPQSLDLQLTQGRRHLNVIATPLSLQGEEGVLLVLHDLTQARRVETTRREFVANVSHELRTPLASIKASAETLVEGASEDPIAARQFLDRISLNVDRMSLLVQELLDLSRLESGEVKLNLSSIDVYGTIQDVVEIHRESARAKGVELMVDRLTPVPDAVADEARLQQVLSNLVENAIKFTPAGGQVHIDVASREGWLEVSVADPGIGMTPDELHHVFERFYKVNRSFNHGGTGLGLAIAKHIVQSHGGRIWAESRVGEGSTFTFTIPADKTRP